VFVHHDLNAWILFDWSLNNEFERNFKKKAKPFLSLTLSLSPLSARKRAGLRPFSFSRARAPAHLAQLRTHTGPAQPSLPFLSLRPLTGGTRLSGPSPTFSRVNRAGPRAPPAVTGRLPAPRAFKPSI
jgi:hypothetical protein